MGTGAVPNVRLFWDVVQHLHPLGILSGLLRLAYYRRLVSKPEAYVARVAFQYCATGRRGRTRTCDPLLRRQVLYPTELRARVSFRTNLP